MQVEVVRKALDPVPPPICAVVLRLTLDEARKLADVCGTNVGVPKAVLADSRQASSAQAVRDFVTAIFDRLHDQGILRTDANWREVS